MQNWQNGAIRLSMAATLMWLTVSAALACSTVALGPAHRPVIAYSFDFAATGAGFLYVNPAAAARSSVMDDNPAQWTVAHGSVTFSQMGPGMPAAGMNTAGLVVSLMWNDEARYSGKDPAPVVTELEFIQRLLDISGSVEEALEAIRGVHIRGFVPIHFFIADRTGAMAIITPTNAGLLVHSNENMPVPALTNTHYDKLLSQLAAFDGFGGDRPLPDAQIDPGSLQRFAIAADAARRFVSPAALDDAFEVLDRLANRTSRWQIVFDPVDQRVTFRIVGRSGTFAIDLSTIDFHCCERPLAAELSRLDQPGGTVPLAAVEPAAVAAVSRRVLSAFTDAPGLSPDLADGLTAGLLASLNCGS